MNKIQTVTINKIPIMVLSVKFGWNNKNIPNEKIINSRRTLDSAKFHRVFDEMLVFSGFVRRGSSKLAFPSFRQNSFVFREDARNVARTRE